MDKDGLLARVRRGGGRPFPTADAAIEGTGGKAAPCAGTLINSVTSKIEINHVKVLETIIGALERIWSDDVPV